MAMARKNGMWPALAAFVGTIIGAGIFGVPYVFMQAGVGVGLIYMAVLGVLSTLITLYLAEVVLSVRHHHRFPGFAEHLLGRPGKAIGAFLAIIGGWFACAIYIILGGTFLWLLFGPLFGGTEFLYQLIVAALGAVVVFGGLGWVARSELPLTILLVLVLALIVIAGIVKFQPANFQTGDLAHWFVPYGVILFALGGTTAVPEMEDMLGNGNRRSLRRAIIIGMTIATLLTAAFGVAVLGVGGGATSPYAIAGLVPYLGNWVVFVGAAFGFLAVITSFFVFLMNQLEIFRFDYKLSYGFAWLLAVGVPFLLFLAGGRDFIQMLGIAGGILGGMGGILIVVMYLVLLKKQSRLGARVVAPALVGLVFLVGAITQITELF